MKYGKCITEKQATVFLLMSMATLAFNCLSQALAFPLQCSLIIFAVLKCDVKLVPGMFLLMLDKSNFTFFHASAVKLMLGFAISPQNVFLIMCLVVGFAGFFRNKYDKSVLAILMPWMSCIVPALMMALPAKEQGLNIVWQSPILLFLTPSLYFWGINLGDSWDAGKDYCITRLTAIFAFINVLELFRLFSIFTFAEHITMIAMCVGCFILRVDFVWKLIGSIGVFFATGCVLFNRYLHMLEETGFTSTADIGSTFTRVIVVVIGVALMLAFSKFKMTRSGIRSVPYVALVFCLSVFFYSTTRASSNKASDEVERNYQSILERFEYKLIGDRGLVWSSGLEEAFTPPYFVKNLSDQIVMGIDHATGEIALGVKLMPHNQVLTLLGRSGWWLGLFLVLFLWLTHVIAFRCAADMRCDRLLLCVLLAPYAGVFIPVCLTGQSVISHLFCSNGLITMIFPGIIYGVWQERRKLGMC